jgi:hypothetical protein
MTTANDMLMNFFSCILEYKHMTLAIMIHMLSNIFPLHIKT